MPCADPSIVPPATFQKTLVGPNPQRFATSGCRLQSAEKFFLASQVGTFVLMSGHRAISRQRFIFLMSK
jgi:hypothetical protein